MEFTLQAKAAAFCRELGNDGLKDLARQQGMEPVFDRARAALATGRIGPELESDLDALDAMTVRAEGWRLFPAANREFAPLPMPGDDTGTQWWRCLPGWCAGRGRVRPGQDPPVCAVTGRPLVAGPLTR